MQLLPKSKRGGIKHSVLPRPRSTISSAVAAPKRKYTCTTQAKRNVKRPKKNTKPKGSSSTTHQQVPVLSIQPAAAAAAAASSVVTSLPLRASAVQPSKTPKNTSTSTGKKDKAVWYLGGNHVVKLLTSVEGDLDDSMLSRLQSVPQVVGELALSVECLVSDDITTVGGFENDLLAQIANNTMISSGSSNDGNNGLVVAPIISPATKRKTNKKQTRKVSLSSTSGSSRTSSSTSSSVLAASDATTASVHSTSTTSPFKIPEQPLAAAAAAAAAAPLVPNPLDASSKNYPPVPNPLGVRITPPASPTPTPAAAATTRPAATTGEHSSPQHPPTSPGASSTTSSK